MEFQWKHEGNKRNITLLYNDIWTQLKVINDKKTLLLLLIIIPTYKERHRKACSTYNGISFLPHPKYDIISTEILKHLTEEEISEEQCSFMQRWNIYIK